MSSRRRVVVPAAALAVALAMGACGSDDFPNEPRPPAPIEMSANVTKKRVVISPRELGAGPVNITVSNQSPDPATLIVDGPTLATGQPIPPGGVDQLNAVLEQGDYEISGGTQARAEPATLAVGPTRPSAQNDLLLP